jgi:hypothetical protein
MTATSMPRHEGRTGWRDLVIPWVNRFKSGLLDILLPLQFNCELRTTVCRWSRHYDKDGAYRRWRTYPSHIGDPVEVFSKEVQILVGHWSIDYAINLAPGYNLAYGRIYNLSELSGAVFLQLHGLSGDDG